jgi:hypothetical protein
MSRVLARLQIVVIAFAVVLGAGATGAQAQGLVTMQKLSASLRMSLWVQRSQAARGRVIW